MQPPVAQILVCLDGFDRDRQCPAALTVAARHSVGHSRRPEATTRMRNAPTVARLHAAMALPSMMRQIRRARSTIAARWECDAMLACIKISSRVFIGC